MGSDGKRLEGLVAYIEETFLPAGLSVSTNDRVFNNDGIQIAEFDVRVKGRVGTTDFDWLIECRDRPASGPAPVSWIEQLVGRRDRFKFNKVTAVSTTGFVADAYKFACEQGVELREVANLSTESFSDWLMLRCFKKRIQHSFLQSAYFVVDPATPQNSQECLKALLQSATGDLPVLRSSCSGVLSTPTSAFFKVVKENEQIFEGVIPNGATKKIRLHVKYRDDDHYTIDTALGPVRICEIVFTGELGINEETVPLVSVGEYRKVDGELISQIASFEGHTVLGMNLGLEIVKVAETGVTHVLVRRVADSSTPRHQ